jgi:hypothetical protein
MTQWQAMAAQNHVAPDTGAHASQPGHHHHCQPGSAPVWDEALGLQDREDGAAEAQPAAQAPGNRGSPGANPIPAATQEQGKRGASGVCRGDQVFTQASGLPAALQASPCHPTPRCSSW